METITGIHIEILSQASQIKPTLKWNCCPSSHFCSLCWAANEESCLKHKHSHKFSDVSWNTFITKESLLPTYLYQHECCIEHNPFQLCLTWINYHRLNIWKIFIWALVFFKHINPFFLEETISGLRCFGFIFIYYGPMESQPIVQGVLLVFTRNLSFLRAICTIFLRTDYLVHLVKKIGKYMYTNIHPYLALF